MNTPAAINVQVVADDHFGAAAADAVLSHLPDELARLGVATGATPLLLYRELGRRARSRGIDLRRSVLVALDEYVGLAPDDPRSYSAYVHATIAGPLDVDAADVVVPDSWPPTRTSKRPHSSMPSWKWAVSTCRSPASAPTGISASTNPGRPSIR